MAITFRGSAKAQRRKIIGLDIAMKRLKRLEKSSDSLLMTEMLRAGTRIAKRANRDVPVDTGRLSRSIAVRRQGKNVIVDVPTLYAGFVEKGTRFMKAQPYLFKHIPPSLKLMIANLKRILTK